LITSFISYEVQDGFFAEEGRDDHCADGHKRRADGVSRDEAQDFVDALLALVKPMEIYFLWRPQLHDPNDEMVLETAINGQADAIFLWLASLFRRTAGVLRQT
jgi:hypothetical protein